MKMANEKIEGLDGLEIYKLALNLSNLAWTAYLELAKEYRYHIGGQFIESVDSVGANIAEGFGRYHYKDSLKFYYNARGSLLEAKHWFTLLYQRELISQDKHIEASDMVEILGKKLNHFIAALKQLS
jgi:four helix bundle protein